MRNQTGAFMTRARPRTPITSPQRIGLSQSRQNQQNSPAMLITRALRGPLDPDVTTMVVAARIARDAKTLFLP